MGDSIYYELSDDEIFRQISTLRVKGGLPPSSKDFRMWNATSLKSLFVACSGYNGDKVRQQGVNILLDYRNWFRYKFLMRTPSWMWHLDKETVFLDEIIDFIQKNSVQQGDEDDLRNFQEKFGKMDKFSELF